MSTKAEHRQMILDFRQRHWVCQASGVPGTRWQDVGSVPDFVRQAGGGAWSILEPISVEAHGGGAHRLREAGARGYVGVVASASDCIHTMLQAYNESVEALCDLRRFHLATVRRYLMSLGPVCGSDTWPQAHLDGYRLLHLADVVAGDGECHQSCPGELKNSREYRWLRWSFKARPFNRIGRPQDGLLPSLLKPVTCRLNRNFVALAPR